MMKSGKLLHLIVFGNAKGEMVADRIFQTMAKDGLPIPKLCTLVRDGPNVNKTIFGKLEGAIKDDTPDFNGFVDLGSCVLHNIYNAFGKGLEDYGKDIEQMCVSYIANCNGCGDAQFSSA